MRNQKGFTLAEILVVFAIFSIISAVGIVSFAQYSTAHALTASTANLVSLLQYTKINALTQVMPSLCTQQLTKYRLRVLSDTVYEMAADCDGKTYSLRSYSLSKGVRFDAGGTKDVVFLVGGTTSSGGTIILHGMFSSETIQIDEAGNVTVE